MPKIKLTKTELKNQKDSLKRFERFLPTLILKKQQLQTVIRDISIKISEIKKRQYDLALNIGSWISVFGEKNNLDDILCLESILIENGNIAGVEIPVFRKVVFKTAAYDLFKSSLWIDKALLHLKEMLTLEAEIEVLIHQTDALSRELKITSQRVNLFEKIKIPETKNNIKKIRIYLGDQETAAVIRGKIAKANLLGSVL